MGFTIDFMLFPPSHPLSAEKEARRYKRGDIVAIRNLGPVCPVKRFGSVHVIDGPVEKILKLRDLMNKELNTFNLIDGRLMTTPIRKRIWTMVPRLASSNATSALLKNREISTTWDEVKAVIGKRLPVDNLNESLDTIDRILTDGDLI